MAKDSFNEEVSFTPIIRDLERIVNKLLKFILRLFTQLIKLIKKLGLFCFKNYRLVILGLIVGGILGLFSFYVIPQTYSSTIILKYQIDAREQLHSDINYFNALAENQHYKKLGEILGISEEDAKSILEFKIDPYFIYLEHLKLADQNYRSLDSSTQKVVPLSSMIVDGHPELINSYQITIESKNQAIFGKIEPALIQFLERIEKLQDKRKNTIRIMEERISTLKSELIQLDTLKQIMNKAIIYSSKSRSNASGMSILSFGEPNEDFTVNPIKVYQRYLDYTNKIAYIENQLEDYESCYIISSHFSPYGRKSNWNKTERLIFSSLSFSLLLLIIKGLRINQFSAS